MTWLQYWRFSHLNLQLSTCVLALLTCLPLPFTVHWGNANPAGKEYLGATSQSKDTIPSSTRPFVSAFLLSSSLSTFCLIISGVRGVSRHFSPNQSVHLSPAVFDLRVCVCMSPLTGVLACLMFWLGISLTFRLVKAHPVQSHSRKRKRERERNKSISARFVAIAFRAFAAKTSLVVLLI